MTETTTKIQTLVEINQGWLRQAAALLESITDEQYAASPAGLEPHRAGGHLRHILEFFDCLLIGLPSGNVDYDARRRDTTVERSRAVAIDRIREIVARLRRIETDSLLRVRMEDAESLNLSGSWLTSSIGRELQTMSSHTIHHFALISMTLRALGVPVDPAFGMAPSTLAHQKRLREAA